MYLSSQKQFYAKSQNQNFTQNESQGQIHGIGQNLQLNQYNQNTGKLKY